MEAVDLSTWKPNSFSQKYQTVKQCQKQGLTVLRAILHTRSFITVHSNVLLLMRNCDKAQTLCGTDFPNNLFNFTALLL